MSVIFKGDLNDNFGRYLPAPFIRRITVNDDNILVSLSVYLNVDEDQDVDSTISALYGDLHLYLYMTVDPTHFENVTDGKKNVLEYLQNEQFSVDVYSASDIDPGDGYITIDNIFASRTDRFGNISYDYLANKDLYDEQGARVWEFRIEKTIQFSAIMDSLSTKTVAGLWQNYYYGKYKGWYDNHSLENTLSFSDYLGATWKAGLYIGAFSSILDLDDEDLMTAQLENLPLIKVKVSDVSYETVFENTSWSSDLVSTYADVPMPARIQIEYLDATGAIYSRPPLQSITSRYFTDDNITSAEIVDHFQKLIDETSILRRPRVKKMTEQISYILRVYGSKTDLLPQLNSLRNLFPIKSTAKPLGKFYSRFKKRITAASRAVELGGPLKKQQIRNPKLMDSRSRPADSYVAPTSAVDLATLESRGAEYIYPKWYISREYDVAEEVYTNYGYFFFDYEKALLRTSALGQVYNLSKLTELFGLDFPYHSFYIAEASIHRYEDAVSLSESSLRCARIASIMKDIDGTPSYPLTETIKATNGTYDSDNLIFPYSTTSADTVLGGAAATDTDYGFATTSAVPMLVVRKWEPAPSAATTNLPLPVENYRLLMFEFQDYFKNEPEQEVLYYGANITIIDSTKVLAREIKAAYTAHLDLLSEYTEAANSMCSYNNDAGEFNAFFTDAVVAFYSDNLESAPWHTAPAVYAAYKDLVYDTFEGDKDAMAEYASAIIDNINPYNGNLESLQKFYDDMQSLYDALYDRTSGAIAVKLEEYDSENEIEYELAVGEGTLWGDAWTTSLECYSDSECAEGEKCWTNNACVDADYCTTDAHCEEFYICDTTISKCVVDDGAGFAGEGECESDGDCDPGQKCSSYFCVDDEEKDIDDIDDIEDPADPI